MNLRLPFVYSGLLAGALSPLAFAQGPAVAPRARPVANVFTATPGTSTYVGVYLAEIDGERAKTLKLREERGVEVTKVEEDSPAAKAGLKVGDVILDYNGQHVEGIEQFRRFVRETPGGRDVKMAVSREGALQNVIVRVASRKTPMAMEPMISMGAIGPRIELAPEMRLPRAEGGGGMLFFSNSILGIEAEGLEGQLAQFFGVKEGVLVRSVRKGTAAEKAGLKAGDVITKVDDTHISSPSELSRAVRAARSSSKKSFPVVVTRDKKESSVTVTVDSEDRSEFPGQFFFDREEPRLPVGRIIRL